jgi:hypothetical protein
MVQIDDYVLLAAAVYNASEENTIKVNSWAELTSFTTDSSSGFSAKAYSNGSEVVIAYAGTTPGIDDWLTGNAAAIARVGRNSFSVLHRMKNRTKLLSRFL